MKNYDTYKPSGVEWLGDIPVHWEVKKLKYLIKKIIDNRGRTPKFGEFGIPMLEIENITNGIKEPTSIFNKFVQEEIVAKYERDKIILGDILISTVGATSGKVVIILTKPNFFIAQNVVGLRANEIVSNLFLYYILYSTYFLTSLKLINKGNTIDNLKVSIFINNNCILPPIHEQEKIAQFLDDKTTKIDKAISIKQQQIELLKERRQILIHQAVTKGVKTLHATSLRDSGVEWIGEIPEGWEVKRLKYLGNSIIGLTYNPNDLCGMEEGTLVLRSSNLFEGKFKYGEKENAYVKTRIPQKLLIRENDILICSRNGSRDLIGKCALATMADAGHSFGAFTTVFRSNINPYIFCILNSSIFKALSGMFLTSTINQLTIGNLNSIEVPIPPINEMDEVRNYVENINLKVDTAISLKEQEIEKLKEYKSSLINDVVTGKVMVE